MRKLIIITALLLLNSPVFAQNYDLRGNVRSWIKNYTHDPQDQGLMETKVKLELLSAFGENSAFRVKSYYTYDGLTKVSDWNFQEAYIDLYYDWMDLRIGKQLIAWGKADELNPTDILNPQDLSNLTEEKHIRKIGLTMIKSRFFIGDNTLTLVWKPEFDHNRFAFDNPRLSVIPLAAFSSVAPNLPENEIDKTEWAVKWERTFGYVDVSASYFDGWDNIFTPVFSYDLWGAPHLDGLVFSRTKMYAADFAGSFSSVGLWGEAAYFHTSDSEGIDPFVKNPYFQMVLGTDYNFANGIKINFQYFSEFLTKVDNQVEREMEEAIISRLGLGLPIRKAVSSRIGKNFGESEQHSLEIMSIFDVEDSGYLLQPKIKYSPEDALVFEIGFAVFGGEIGSLFGRFGKNDEVYLKTTYSF
ncbi:hypothetical protein ACFL7D_12010 [candidate division KSB1 bacterium]